MGRVVRTKLPCDHCGSSDAVAEYEDGGFFCFSCETPTLPHVDRGPTYERPKESVNLTGQSQEFERALRLWRESAPVAIPERNVNSTSVSRYGIVVDGDKQYYPYFDPAVPGDPVAFKVRTVSTKGFGWLGDGKVDALFGQHLSGNYDRKRVIVTEGELDALAAYQMVDGKATVVSLKGGAAAAGRDFKATYEWLDGFDEIIVCFDADEAGAEGVNKAADVFAGKLRVMKLDPKTGKDACDYLRAGSKAQFVEAFWSASMWTPTGVVDKQELLDRLLAPRPAQMGEYPWPPLNELTFGFRPTELITVCAGSGLGKSSILREIVMHIKDTTENKIGVLFMEEAVTRTAEGFMGIDLSTPVHLPTSPVTRGSQEYLDSFNRVFGDDQLFIMDASFDTGATVDQVVSRVRFMAKALDCKVIILDHISILVSGGQHGDERKALDEIMTKLRTLTQDTGITLFAVSHLKRPDGKGHEEGAVTSVAQLRGSASIAQLSDFVIGLERNGQAEDPTERNTTQIRVLKNRFSGTTGPAGYVLYDHTTGRLEDYEPIKAEEDAL